jgi:hypothetical protein
MKPLSSEELLAHVIRFRFGDYEVSKFRSWWEIWDIKDGISIRHPHNEYCFTQEEAIETARRLAYERETE